MDVSLFDALDGRWPHEVDDLVQEVPETLAPDAWTLALRMVEGFFMGLQLAQWIWG